MPAHALPLKANEPKKRPPDVPDGLWMFPRNLADWGNDRGLSQNDLAAAAGVVQSSVSRWLNYDEASLRNLTVSVVLRLERALKLPHGTLTHSAPHRVILTAVPGEPMVLQQNVGGSVPPVSVQASALAKVPQEGTRGAVKDEGGRPRKRRDRA